MRRVFTRSLILPATACVAIGNPAFAQQSGGIITPPPESFNTSPGGVDMRTGEYVYEATDISIGEDSDQGGIVLERTLRSDVLGHASPFGNFSHNFEIMATYTNVNILEGNYQRGPGPDENVNIHYDGRVDAFERQSNGTLFLQRSRTTFARLTFSGTFLSGGVTYTYHASDGTMAIFRPMSANVGDCSTVDRCAYVSHIVHPDGTRVDFSYDSGGAVPGNATRLRRVTSSRGYAMLLEYGTGTPNQISRACVLNLTIAPAPASNICPANALATSNYTYTGSSPNVRMSSATDANGATSTFTYTPLGSNIEMRFFRPGESTAWLTNTFYEQLNNDGLTEEIISRQAFADGSHFTYTFTLSPQMEGQIPSIAGGTFTNALGETVRLEYGFFLLPATFSGPAPVDCCELKWQITPGPISVTDALGRVTLTDWCDPNAMANLPPWERNRCLVRPVPTSVTDPEGLRTVMTWDITTRNLTQSRRVARPGSGLPDIISSATYDCTVIINCTKPTSVTDGRGNFTNYTYDPIHGGLLTQTGPAVTVVRPDGTSTANVRPQTRNTYVQRHAWVSNGSGGFVQSATPAWLLATTSMCRGSAATGNPAAPCAIAGDEVLTTYDYGPNSGPNNLLLRGIVVTADGVSLRTCYTYDQRGRRISETSPNANLTSCP